MAITVANFKVRFPEFSDETDFPDARVQLFLDDAVAIYMGTDELRWGTKYDYAQAYLGAHLLTQGANSEVGDSSSKVGPISSKSAGGVSLTRAVVAKDRADSDEFFMSTVYGQQFLITRNRCFVGVLVANSL